MKHILFVDACPRKSSRTRQLATAYLDSIKQDNEVEYLNLFEYDLKPFDEEKVELRENCCKNRVFDDPMFDFAKQLQNADELVIAAPVWDLSFPSLLKVYIEYINVVGFTFYYGQDGHPQSLLKLQRLDYITTSVGPCPNGGLGFAYIKAVFESFYNLKDVRLHYANGLDIIGADVDAILAKAKKEILK